MQLPQRRGDFSNGTIMGSVAAYKVGKLTVVGEFEIVGNKLPS